MEAEANDSSLDSPARRLLVRQEKLVGWQIAGERAGFVLKCLTGAAGVAVAVCLGVMIWQAGRASGLTIEPFSVPPDLAARGITGEVVASKVLDRLVELQVGTSTIRRSSSITNDWGNDLRIAIPDTGVNLAEVQTALKRWLGHETRISGQVYRTSKGLVLTIRASGKPSFVAQGADDEIDEMAHAAADDLVETTQPYRYSMWLSAQGDVAAAARRALYERVARTDPSPRERAWALRGLAFVTANIDGDLESSVGYCLKALRLLPKMSATWQILADVEGALGHGEASLKARRNAIIMAAKDEDLEDWARAAEIDRRSQALALGDFQTSQRWADAIAQNLPAATNLGDGVQANQVRALVGLHEISAARAILDTTLAPTTADAEARAGRQPAARFGAVWAAEFAAEDWKGLVDLAAGSTEAQQAAFFRETRHDRPSTLPSIQLIYAKAKLGDLAGATAEANRTALDCDRCLVLRGQLAAMAGDVATSERWFAAASALSPSLPQAPFQWGMARLERGDAKLAVDSFRLAQLRGPGWADPYRYEGDALMALGRTDAALFAYAKAFSRAPRWGGLHLAWGKALRKAGKGAEAQAQWRTAAGLDLTPAERAELQTLTEKRTL